MTQICYPLANSPILTVEQWSKMAQHLVGAGVFKGILNELQTFADSTGMQVKVKSGRAWIKSHLYESDAEEVLSVGTADATNPRIDLVIIRVDWINNSYGLAVLQGVPAVSPVAPSLTQNSARWEIALAQVNVDAAVSTIASGKVVDKRTYAATIIEHSSASSLKHIAESGSNSNGRYIKFDDGTMICKGEMTIAPFNVTTAIGAFYRSSRFIVVFPAVFVDRPAVSISNYGGTGEALFMYQHGGVNVNYFYVHFIDSVSTTNRTETLNFLAIGRWK